MLSTEAITMTEIQKHIPSSGADLSLDKASLNSKPTSELQLTRELVEGVVLGTAVGDALGLPFETQSAEQIRLNHGRVTTFIGGGHRDFSDAPPGTWSDDTQLTLAILDSLSSQQNFSIESIANRHIESLNESGAGWGKSTRDSILRYAESGDWQTSGKASQYSGVGNGIAMKISPMGLYAASNEIPAEILDQQIADISRLTHPTSLATSSGLAQTYGILSCLEQDPSTFSSEKFIKEVVSASARGRSFLPETLNDDDLTKRLKLLPNFEDYDESRIIDEFGGGTSYVYNSLPFSMMFFLKNPTSMESIYNVVNAGGDTDTNGAIVGALLGALNGPGVFPRELISKLHNPERISEATDRFCDSMNIN